MRSAPFLCLAIVLLAAASTGACTGVVISRDGKTLVGVNEDWFRPDAYVWASPAPGRLHAVVYFGYEVINEFGPNEHPFWYEFQGVNDAGLFFDSFSAPCGVEEGGTGGRRYVGRMERLIMQTCGSVEDAVRVMTQYDRSYMDCMQYLLVDRSGAAAVVEAGTVVWMEDDTLAVTNFHLSDPSHDHHPCWRYAAATRALKANSEPSVGRITYTLSTARTASTQYSIVCDLAEDVAYVYYLGNFARPLAVDLKTLWSEGSSYVPLSSLGQAEN